MKLIDEFNFYQTLAETSGVALVFFTGPHCGSCHHLREVLRQFRQRNPLVSIFEVDAGVSTALTNEYNVFHLPDMHLFKNGQYHCRFHSEARIPALEQNLREALAQAPQDEP